MDLIMGGLFNADLYIKLNCLYLYGYTYIWLPLHAFIFLTFATLLSGTSYEVFFLSLFLVLPDSSNHSDLILLRS